MHTCCPCCLFGAEKYKTFIEMELMVSDGLFSANLATWTSQSLFDDKSIEVALAC